jgi:oxepin-CoA hydrolase/3-oxo-5,6-dehydrosuberyl-CoA semialdehyde dehydrogenase
VLSFIGGSAAAAIDHLDTQDILAFTGSAETANNLKRHPRVIERSVRVNVEADSLNASVLGPDVAFDADAMQLFLRDVARDMTQKTGQKCTAVRRIFIPEARLKEVEEELAARLSAVKIGNPALKEVGMGPVATAAQLEDVKAGIARLREEAEVVSGDPHVKPQAIGVEGGKGYFISPVLLRVRDSANARAVHNHEVFGPVATILPYGGSAEEVSQLVRRGGGGLVASVYSDDRAFTESMFEGIAAFSGRLYLGSGKVLEHATGPGLVLPSCVHGGPGRAGGGEELGGLRGVEHFMQRVVVQGSRPTVEQLTDTKPSA